MLILISLAGAVEPCPDPTQSSCWVGGWRQNARAMVAVTQEKEGLTAHLLLGGDPLNAGPLIGDGLTRTAAVGGCGATLTLKPDGSLRVDLDGPECPIEVAGTHHRASMPNLEPTLCLDSRPMLTCATTNKRVLSVCEKRGELVYRYGTRDKLELELFKGKAGKRTLAGGDERTWTFANGAYSYTAFDVIAGRDTGAGVLVEKDGKAVATVSCSDKWFTQPR